MKLYDHYMRQLDIQRVINNSFNLRNFLRAYLSKTEQVMLAHQRSRFKGDGYSSQSSAEEDFEKFDPDELL